MNNDNTDEGGSKNLAEVDDGSKKANDDDDDDNTNKGGGENKEAQWKHGNAEDNWKREICILHCDDDYEDHDDCDDHDYEDIHLQVHMSMSIGDLQRPI